MLAHLSKRLGYYALLLALAVVISYALSSLALSPRGYFEGRQPAPPPDQVEAQLTALGINDRTPLWERFGSWLTHALRGDFGRTIDSSSVGEEFGRRIWVSLRLLLAGTALGVLAGVLLGTWGAIRQYRLSDRAVTLLAFLLLSTPTFLLAVLLKVGTIKVNAAAGREIISFTGEKTPGLTGDFATLLGDRAVHLLLPTLAIALGTAAAYSRYQRGTMLDVLGSDFLRTARAKGLRKRTAVLRHGLRTALVPMSTFFAYGFLALFTGAAFTEKVFGWHGMGSWFIDAVGKSDINSVVAVNLFAAVMVLLSGFLADVLHAALDPRVRTNRAGATAP